MHHSKYLMPIYYDLIEDGHGVIIDEQTNKQTNKQTKTYVILKKHVYNGWTYIRYRRLCVGESSVYIGITHTQTISCYFFAHKRMFTGYLGP